MAELGIIALVVALAGVGVLALRPGNFGASAIWAWGWVVVFAAYLASSFEALPWVGALGLLFGALFSWIQLSGARVYAGRADLRWLMVVGLSVGGARALLAWRGHPELAYGATALVDAVVLGCAAVLAFKGRSAPAPSLAERALPLAFVGLAMLEFGDGVSKARGISLAAAMPVWTFLAPLTWICQAQALGDRNRAERRLRDQRREQIVSELRDSESRFRALAANSEDWIAEVDAAGTIIYLSPRFEEGTGLPASDFVGRSAPDFFGPNHAEEIRSILQRALRAEEVPPVTWRWPPEGEPERWFETRSRAFEDASGQPHLVSSTRDVTAQLAMERELRQAHDDLEQRVVERTAQLREREERYRRVSELTSDYSYAIRLGDDGRQRLLWVTGAFSRLTGYDPAEAWNMGWSGILAPEDRRAAEECKASLASGHEVEHEYRIITKSGAIRWLHERARAERSPEGDATLRFGAAHDVTERKRAEEEREEAQTQLRESQRIESLGVLAAGVAHDFNNLLTPILGNSRAGLDESQADSSAHARFERIEGAARVAAGLVTQMLTYAGRGSFEMKPLDLSAQVADMVALLEAGVSESARLDVDLPRGLPAINADETQVRQVVLNFITNASEAVTAGGGTIFVRTGVVYADRSLLARALHRGELSEGAYVMLEVRDDGVGMSPETCRHVFEPFFSTKFSGRGLGLAAVLGIVHGHGGAILLDSEPGQGTRFRVLFPIDQSATSDAEPPAEQPFTPRCGRVLVVDDEEAVSEVAREFLERGGFQVRVAVGGVEGLRVFSEHRAEIDAVVLDWRMPDLDGAGVLKRIRELAPTMPVVIASGLDDPGSGTGGPVAESAGFVAKPFEWETLLGVVGTAIARREPGL